MTTQMTTHVIPVVPSERQPATTWLRRAASAIGTLSRTALRTGRRAAAHAISGRSEHLISAPDADPASVQRILVELGRLDRLHATGETNPATTHAVAAFQRMNGLPADGVADARTVHALARAWHTSSGVGLR